MTILQPNVAISEVQLGGAKIGTPKPKGKRNVEGNPRKTSTVAEPTPKKQEPTNQEVKPFGSPTHTPLSATHSSKKLDGPMVSDKLPDFLSGTNWKNQILPALYQHFACSANPFTVVDVGSSFVKLIHGVIESVHPDSNYKASSYPDDFYQKVSTRFFHTGIAWCSWL
jgi:hypothetical protein